MRILLVIALLSLGGCSTLQKRMERADSRIEDLVTYLSWIAPEGEDDAIDGYRQFTLKNVGKVRVDFKGMYQEDGFLKVKEIHFDGHFTEYSGSPFAWKLQT